MSQDDLDLEAGRRLFAKPVHFVMGAVDLDQLPPPDRVEVAFAGRSNVGKSSLLNALSGQKALARTSGEPGRTRELNFFDMEGGPIRLVDLPGYGYARAPKPVVQKWTKLTERFLRGQVNLKRVFLLIDSRHGVKPVDEGVMGVFDETAVSYQIVLTKIDKLKPSEVEPRIAETAQSIIRRPAAFPEVIATSSSKRDGLERLRAHIAGLAPQS